MRIGQQAPQRGSEIPEAAPTDAMGRLVAADSPAVDNLRMSRRLTIPTVVFVAVIVIPVVILQLPAIWFALHTQFAFVDDIGSSQVVQDLSNWAGLKNWLYGRFVSFDPSFRATHGSPLGRFQLTYDLYNFLTWAGLGHHPGLHHLARLAIKLAIILITIATFRRVLSDSGGFRFSVFLFVCLYAFFPSNPEARLAPQELLVVLFLAFHGYTMVGYLGRSRRDGKIGVFPSLGNYIGLLASFCFLLWSKEPTLAFGAVSLATLLVAARTIRGVIERVPFLAVFAHAAAKSYFISKQGGYGTAPVTESLIQGNLEWGWQTVFLSDVGSFFWVSCILLIILFILTRFMNRPSKLDLIHGRVPPSPPLVPFFLFVASNGMAYFAISLTFWIHVLRYLYPCTYCLITLIALAAGASYASLFSVRCHKPRWWFVRFSSWLAGCVFAVYFVGVNYFNFLSQYAVQYYSRATEQKLVEGIVNLAKDKNRVRVPVYGELEDQVLLCFDCFYNGLNVERSPWPPQVESDTFVVGRMDPAFAGWPVYQEFGTHRTLAPVLSRAERLSGWLQRRHPPVSWRDAGVWEDLSGMPWYIFKN